MTCVLHHAGYISHFVRRYYAQLRNSLLLVPPILYNPHLVQPVLYARPQYTEAVDGAATEVDGGGVVEIFGWAGYFADREALHDDLG